MKNISFEYDINKSKINKEKHNIDFEEAQELWNNPKAVILTAKTIGQENRFAIVSRLNQKCYVAIFTIRKNKIRIISVRRCRKNEESSYENTNN